MKNIIIILAVLSIGSIAVGTIWNFESSPKFVGGGVVGLFFVVFPLFIYHRWKKKSFKDYMLTQENFDKMKERSKDF